MLSSSSSLSSLLLLLRAAAAATGAYCEEAAPSLLLLPADGRSDPPVPLDAMVIITLLLENESGVELKEKRLRDERNEESQALAVASHDLAIG